MKRYLQKTVMILLLLGGVLFLRGCIMAPEPVLQYTIFKFKDGMDYSNWARTAQYYLEHDVNDLSKCIRVDRPIPLDSGYYVAFLWASQWPSCYVNISIENWNNNIRPVDHLKEVDSLVVLDAMEVYSECYTSDDQHTKDKPHIKWKKLEPNSEGSIATYFDTAWFNGLIRDHRLWKTFTIRSCITCYNEK